MTSARLPFERWVDVAAVLGLLLALLGLVAKAGPLVATLALAAGLMLLALLANPRFTLVLALVVVIVLEGNDQWGIPQVYEAYRTRAAATGLADGLLYVAYGSVALLILRRRSLRPPDPFTSPLGLLAVLLLAGTIWGETSGDAVRYQVVSTFQSYTPVFLVPVAVVNVMDHLPDVRRVIAGFSVLAIFKALTGLFVVFAGLAVASPGVPALTFYEPAGNLVLLAFALGLVAVTVAGVPVRPWVRVLGLLVLLCLLLSYRRTFWVASVAGGLMVLLVASGQAGRRLGVPLLLVVAAVAYVGLRDNVAGQSSGAIATRIESLNPTRLKSNNQDRYRLAERRNIVAELRDHPLMGIGVGVEWSQRYPLNFEQDNLQFYSHVALLWHWLKYGVLGALAYVWLLLAAAVSGVRTFRRHPDRLVGCAALAAGTAMVGLAIVELASTVIGPDFRGGVVAGLLLGFLAAARRTLPPAWAAGAAGSIGRA